MPVDSSIRTLLTPRVLTRAYEQFGALRPTPFTDAFWLNPENVDDDTFTMFYDPTDMQAAPTNNPGAEARVVTVGDGTERVMNLFTVFNKIPLKGVVLTALREPDSHALQNMARTEVNRVLRKFRNRHQILKNLIIAKTVSDGVVYLDNNGLVLESSTDAVQIADFEVPAENKGNLDGTIDDLWSDPDADIQGQLEAIDDAAARKNVPPPTDVWVHKLNMAAFRNNKQVEKWAVNHERYAESILQGEGVIEGLFGKRWHFIRDYYQAADGITRPMLDKTKAILTPPPGDDWIRAHNGPTVVPSRIGLAGSLEEAMNDLQIVHGEFAYAKLVDDPVRLFQYSGDKFALHFAEPNAIWQAVAFAA